MSKSRYTVEILQGGQPRPYADSIYRGILTVEWQGMEGYKDKNAPFIPHDDLREEIVKSRYSRLVHDWHEEPEWFQPRLTSFKKVGAGQWEVTVVEAYTD